MPKDDHTPPAWTVLEVQSPGPGGPFGVKGFRIMAKVDGHAAIVCEIFPGPGPDPVIVSEANARLIAKSPALLDELRSMTIALPSHSADCQRRSVAGAACCYYAERQRNARKLLGWPDAR